MSYKVRTPMAGIHAVPIKMWIDGITAVEDAALNQLDNVAQLPFIFKHVAVMPDVHLGKGATVGSVIPSIGAIVPAAVGVDIGCGMVAARTSLTSHDLPENLKPARRLIEKIIPLGEAGHGELPNRIKHVWYDRFDKSYKTLIAKHPAVDSKRSHPAHKLASLGGGNHFIELCLDEADAVWIMLHSGSRNVGNRIGQYFISKAKEEMEKHFIKLPDKDLAYLVENTAPFDDYIEALLWAQDYAAYNRKLMLELIVTGLRHLLKPFTVADEVVNCHHNYATRENHFGSNVWVTRKGAVRAREGDLGIIPGSMGAKSFIVRGKGNADSFMSCSHGAGRAMSRTKAKATFTLDDHVEATKGVECRKDEGVIDETPGAYKAIDTVIAAQSDLIDVVHTLKAVLCVKG